MAKRTKKEEYAICMERGHVPTGELKEADDDGPAYNICQFCGTNFRTEVVSAEDPATKP